VPLLICRTCPRYDPARTGEFGRDLDSALAGHPAAGEVRIRHVQCLGGCPEHGVVAVDGIGKARVRFTGLTPDDADAIVSAARAHAGCDTGAPDDWDVPAELTGRLSAVTYKRPPV
jgi:predicted metal-binding protein